MMATCTPLALLSTVILTACLIGAVVSGYVASTVAGALVDDSCSAERRAVAKALAFTLANSALLIARMRSWQFVDELSYSKPARIVRRLTHGFEILTASVLVAYVGLVMYAPAYVANDPFAYTTLAVAISLGIIDEKWVVVSSETVKRRARRVFDDMYSFGVLSKAVIRVFVGVGVSTIVNGAPEAASVGVLAVVYAVWALWMHSFVRITTWVIVTEPKSLNIDGSVDAAVLAECPVGSIEEALLALPVFLPTEVKDSKLLKNAYDTQALREWWQEQKTPSSESSDGEALCELNSKRVAIVAQAVCAVEASADGEYVSQLREAFVLKKLCRARALNDLVKRARLLELEGSRSEVLTSNALIISESCMVPLLATTLRLKASISNQAALPVEPTKRINGKVVPISDAFRIGHLPESEQYASESERVANAWHAQEYSRRAKNVKYASKGWWRVALLNHFRFLVDFSEMERSLRGSVKEIGRASESDAMEVLLLASNESSSFKTFKRSPTQAYSSLLQDAFQTADCVEVLATLSRRRIIPMDAVVKTVSNLLKTMAQYEKTYGVRGEDCSSFVRVLKLVSKRELSKCAAVAS